jgi:hypothetical protein
MDNAINILEWYYLVRMILEEWLKECCIAIDFIIDMCILWYIVKLSKLIMAGY